MKKELPKAYADDLIMEKLIGLSQKLRWMQRRQAMEYGLTPLQLSVLHYLYHKKNEPVYPAELASALDITRSTVTEALKSLHGKKMLQWSRDTADARKQQLRLTDWGGQVAHTSLFYLTPLRHIIAPVTPAQKRVLLQHLDGILLKLTAELE